MSVVIANPVVPNRGAINLCRYMKNKEDNRLPKCAWIEYCWDCTCAAGNDIM